ncbi:tRNA-dependent cyclodipeptide synthase [Salinivibrio sp. MA607]|uniref:Cyclodipeptide synthase n=2 Tax=Vibrionaceae TaxID=641 RepID=A0ABX3KP35_SALCS|nr:tRNA-dependent cyclodipeptide synthase [Salinivibrio sp. MA607]OOF33331.1 tRNA-dependent cyclodipeptide synthase [Salinivibrio costicola subsp. alcaliphilus]
MSPLPPVRSFPGEEVSEVSFDIAGETSRCDLIIDQRDHALVGISPFNSRFSKNYVTALVTWAATHFDHIDVLLPCVEEASRLLRATGMEEKKAFKKTDRELRRHKNHLAAVLSSPDFEGRDVRVIQFNHYADHPRYQEVRSAVEDAFESCSRFRKDCLNMSYQAVKGRLKGTGQCQEDVDPELIQKALPYIFAELPFYLDSPSLLGVNLSTLLYHRPWPIGKGLYHGHYPIQVTKNQSYGVVTLTSASEQRV